MPSISVATLSSCLVAPKPPVLIDVRRQGARQASGSTIEKSIWRDPAHWLDWKDEVSALSGQLVFFCVHGHEVSQGLTAALCAMGKDAKYVQGGFSEWQRAGLAVANIASSANDREMLQHGMVMCDALYRGCQDCLDETHNWPPKM